MDTITDEPVLETNEIICECPSQNATENEGQSNDEVLLVHSTIPSEVSTPISVPTNRVTNNIITPNRQILILPNSNSGTNGSQQTNPQLLYIIPHDRQTDVQTDQQKTLNATPKRITLDQYRKIVGHRLMDENSRKKSGLSESSDSQENQNPAERKEQKLIKPADDKTEKPLLRTNFFLCRYCGFLSEITKCQRCGRVIENGKVVGVKQVTTNDSTKNDNVKTPRRTSQRHVRSEPQCVTLSSDDDEAIPEPQAKKAKETLTPTHRDKPTEVRNSCLSLESRLINIGTSLDAEPADEVIFAADGIFLKVYLKGNSKKYCLRIKPSEVVEIGAEFGESEVLRISTSSFRQFRETLEMEDLGEADLVVKIFPKRENLLGSLIVGLGDSDTYHSFVASLLPNVPAEVKMTPKSTQVTPRTTSQRVTRSSKSKATSPRLPVERMFTWLDEFSVTTEDYLCLNDEEFLNDSIIDFYLRFLFRTKLNEEQQSRCHVFSSFFYQRLTSRPVKTPGRGKIPIEDDPNISPAEKRHHRVKSWTKKVDLFNKDFVIVPINEHSHWYLAIICFPGLSGPVRASDNVPVTLPPVVKRPGNRKQKTEALLNSILTAPGKSLTYGATTITVVLNSPGVQQQQFTGNSTPESTNQPVVPLVLTNGKNENRDEAESESDDETIVEEEVKDEASEHIKQPCILILDSLVGASHTRVAATLRDYLKVEYMRKQMGDAETANKIFSKDVMQGVHLKAPQQTNNSDCGVYVLQYVEQFFENPISDYRLPFPSFRDWFPAEVVRRKRQDIQQLLLRLMEENNPNHSSISEFLKKHTITKKDEEKSRKESCNTEENLMEASAPNVVIVPMASEEPDSSIIDSNSSIHDTYINIDEIKIDS